MNFLIIDDHSMIRAGIAIIISKEYPEVNFSEAANEKQALSLLAAKTKYRSIPGKRCFCLCLLMMATF